MLVAPTFRPQVGEPEIADAPCSDALVYSMKSNAMYLGKPYGDDRTNYTILRSQDEGGSWSILGHLPAYQGGTGAGYSDMHLLPTSGPVDLLGVAFQRTLWEPDVEGGGYNMAWAIVDINFADAVVV